MPSGLEQPSVAEGRCVQMRHNFTFVVLQEMSRVHPLDVTVPWCHGATVPTAIADESLLIGLLVNLRVAARGLILGDLVVYLRRLCVPAEQ